eukprot:CAMPEP_0184336218 /NCGR_PEP_ID=MMETSP1089-20130417/4597_1 /TAXON_ID=38269 ORGANISM="Gloeochaete wittrockiana, Strain SAG46.84" /NCGR_SAMPLE_ID=MMETSP1089 /ASSEMBLY_ACC=CAM_ASM_000445 /LENGTH=94 /DNA_ID=CAMNT_0026661183 /DNA_START=426 /DNA_END=707 /DNA_ORIENTATION=-
MTNALGYRLHRARDNNSGLHRYHQQVNLGDLNFALLLCELLYGLLFLGSGVVDKRTAKIISFLWLLISYASNQYWPWLTEHRIECQRTPKTSVG